MSGVLVVRPDELRALAAPVGAAGRVVHEVSGQLGPVSDTGSDALTEAVEALVASWAPALRAHGESVLAVADLLHRAAGTYEAVETLIADAVRR